MALAFLSIASFTQAIADGFLYDFLGIGFPPRAIQAVQSGGTICFMLTFVVRCIAKAIAPDTDDGFLVSGYVYFGFIVLVEITCVIVIITIQPMKPIPGSHKSIQIQDDERATESTNEQQWLIAAQDRPPAKEEPPHIFEVAKKMWPLMIFLSTILFVTHNVYPGLTSIFHTVDGPADSGWFVVILFGCFCIGDFVGKNLPLVKKLYNHRTVWLGLGIHCLFFLATLMGIQHKVAPDVFQNDFYAYSLIAVLGISNGFIMVCGYMSLPEVLEEKYRGVGSSAALFSVYVGLLFGTLSSLLLKHILVESGFAGGGGGE